mmetsp:Transcript_2013/g.3280  ORF Transcript_2013/g.3280 Transcript_2013/m.3280 type:complete len:448 (+) Transcript_2013:140-1483(+)
MDDFQQMMIAAKDNKHEKITDLLDSGIDPNITNKVGQSGLHVASLWGCTEAAQVLLEAGADVNICNQYRWTPLHYAAKGGRFGVVRLLIKAGADTDAVAANGQKPWQLAKDDEMRELCSGVKLELHDAINEWDLTQVRLLVRDGADLSTRDRDGFTALHLAMAIADSEDDALQMLNTLLEAESGPSWKTLAVALATVNRYGFMPLHLAAAKGSAALAEALLGVGAPINARNRLRGTGYDGNWGKRGGDGKLQVIDNQHMTALHIVLERIEKAAEDDDDDDDDVATNSNDLKLVQLLLCHDADVNARDANERAPIHQAVGSRRRDIVMLLLETNADLNAGCKAIGMGNNVLHQAVMQGDARMIQAVLDAGTAGAMNGGNNSSDRLDVNHLGRDGWTPLGLAVRSNNSTAVKLLLDGGADKTVVMTNGRTALDLAKINKYHPIVEILAA